MVAFTACASAWPLLWYVCHFSGALFSPPAISLHCSVFELPDAFILTFGRIYLGHRDFNSSPMTILTRTFVNFNLVLIADSDPFLHTVSFVDLCFQLFIIIRLPFEIVFSLAPLICLVLSCGYVNDDIAADDIIQVYLDIFHRHGIHGRCRRSGFSVSFGFIVWMMHGTREKGG
jgi:hypothetical protein